MNYFAMIQKYKHGISWVCECDVINPHDRHVCEDCGAYRFTMQREKFYCVQCGNVCPNHNKTYCSMECLRIYMKENNTHECRVCKKEVKRFSSNIFPSGNIYCSRECYKSVRYSPFSGYSTNKSLSTPPSEEQLT